MRGGWRFKSGIVESVNLPSVASGFRRPRRNCGAAVTVEAAKAARRIGIARESGYNRALSTQVEFLLGGQAAPGGVSGAPLASSAASQST